MRIAIVGSRGYPHLARVMDLVRSLAQQYPKLVIVSGGARGVDQTAEGAARLYGLEVETFLADWDRLGRRAGIMRNQQIADYSDRMIAFWDGWSRGTLSAMRFAYRQRKPVQVVILGDEMVDFDPSVHDKERKGAER